MMLYCNEFNNINKEFSKFIWLKLNVNKSKLTIVHQPRLLFLG